jgi:hypothetical protein
LVDDFEEELESLGQIISSSLCCPKIGFETLNCIFKDSFYLFSGHARKPLEKIIKRGPTFKILKERDDRDTSVAKDPRAAHLIRVSLYRQT